MAYVVCSNANKGINAMLYLDRFANKPAGFDSTSLEAMIDNAATNGGAFVPVTFKGTPRQLESVLGGIFHAATISNNVVTVETHKGKCTVACNGYVSAWKKEGAAQ